MIWYVGATKSVDKETTSRSVVSVQLKRHWTFK